LAASARRDRQHVRHRLEGESQLPRHGRAAALDVEDGESLHAMPPDSRSWTSTGEVPDACLMLAVATSEESLRGDLITAAAPSGSALLGVWEQFSPRSQQHSGDQQRSLPQLGGVSARRNTPPLHQLVSSVASPLDVRR
jgi:hypothetical protein